MVRFIIAFVLAAGLAACQADVPPPEVSQAAGDPNDTRIAKALFGAAPAGSAQTPQPIGGYSRGCQAGGQQLAETGPTWQAMRLSRNRNWAQPTTIDYVQDLSRFAATQPGWEGLYVGDMSQPRGGPMLTGHVSHQSGLDVDIWMLPPDRLNLTVEERENLSSISMRRQAGAFTNSRWTPQHEEILKAAASDPRTARIFVFPGAKVAMCNNATGDRSWLSKIRPWWGHHYHFHVRLNCPDGATGCTNQTPPPAGDGCDDAQAWVDRILNPPPPDPDAPAPTPRAELTMADLPGQCAAVLNAQ
ncbi:penicillin-insensitive murein endopeptidase [Yoonia maricola]|uniref:Penicillin-insensitive murein endopeptidase n=1 Tax=Yoonia maricola TaxID=420999 RepID=A0A2M8W5G1_9RHOB|nr:penicillin-insensitive murein endopeptidase [Yoonia maricola]PJI86159.1 penicillin-insensitive murein endopeptidase [Yoonia maricola]